MKDVELLKDASRLANKLDLSALWTQRPADDPIAVWKQLNQAANQAYARLFAHAQSVRNFNLPDRSPKLIEKAVRVGAEWAQKAPDRYRFDTLGQLLRWYLSGVAASDAQCEELVTKYASLMVKLVQQSRIVIDASHSESNGNLPPDAERPSTANKAPLALPAPPPTAAAPTYTVSSPAGYEPRSMVAAAPEIVAQFEAMRTAIADAQAQLAALDQRLATQGNAYVPRREYEALLGEWNATRKNQQDRDIYFVMSLIQIITDIRHLYGTGGGTTSAGSESEQPPYGRAVDAMASRLESALASQYDITRIPCDVRAEFDPQIMKVEKADPEPAPDASLVGAVARVVTHGYWRLDAEKNATIYQRIGVIRYGAPEKQRK